MIRYENCINFFNKLILKELHDQGIVCWIAGGIIRSYFGAESVKGDIDLFFPDAKNYRKAGDYFKDKDCKVLYSGVNGTKYAWGKYTVDVINHFFESPQHTIDAFDFTIAMLATDGVVVYSGEHTFIDLAKKQLMINKITFPESTMKRVLKYYMKGFLICNEELSKILDEIRKLPPIELLNNTDNIDDLKDADVSSFSRFRGID